MGVGRSYRWVGHGPNDPAKSEVWMLTSTTRIEVSACSDDVQVGKDLGERAIEVRPG